MANKVRSHRGRVVDMDEIKIKNQEAVALGNMNVNARGDTIDEYGRITKSRDEVARDNIKKQAHSATTKASIISSFEDDDEVVELRDDPKAIERNTKKASTQTSQAKPTASNTSSGSSGSNSKTKDSGKPSSGTSQTDLD